MDDGRWTHLLTRLERMMDRAERLLDGRGPSPPPDRVVFETHWAFRWERQGASGRLVPVEHPHFVDLDDIVGVDDAKETLVRNTAQFVSGHPANNLLLWGERGTGKSSCIKGLLKRFASAGLRIVEARRWDLTSLPAIAAMLRGVPFRFVVFCDDLSFGEGEDDYRILKTLLDGGLEERPENLLIYATSNRRHLMPEAMSDNTGEGEIHPEEAVSEKLGLADRFGVRLGFPRFDQETYLAVVDHCTARLGLPVDRATLHEEALRWAMQGGHRSGRAARQFIDDLAGRLRLGPPLQPDIPVARQVPVVKVDECKYHEGVLPVSVTISVPQWGRCAMKKKLSCRAMGMNCDFVTRDESEEKIVETMAVHLKESHKIELTEELRVRANNLIRLEEA